MNDIYAFAKSRGYTDDDVLELFAFQEQMQADGINPPPLDPELYSL